MARWDEYSNIDYDDELKEIIQFFVIESPVRDVSVRGRSFEERGIRKNYVNRLTNKIKERLPEFADNWDTDTIENLEDRYAGIGVHFETDLSFEFALHYVKDKLNPTTGLYYFIRCSLAHGGFSVYGDNTKYYMLENIHDGKSKGRAVMKESTLLTLRDLVNETTEELERDNNGN